ncbi:MULTISPECIES: Bax inhibitor-1/YccA family protein [unclassified Enterococcus]|uniref:Bax inhibitor-1/YccA family protein n=1 Tax=unclassified Enterococcus TaxID=2608891 RepID=UPI0015557DEE|nr:MULTISPECIES: Bax inhibitor-1/YccA family protein [unclassified Enterococcus]MBS7577536.1 Bax inhibitor-1/YccA family protein [Enterococcus sp. MMGLQ5-2]MBS7584965.1 Bax inhibitor-1/YccA family protein [Enterococcus sp. MMGLQ5-1]NPD12820.1 Bax inhibitor-1/YccA family protein [Enterococcus sp. MMGLQ5-1]NPD37369.1 Bax inhibitor-1/YccA family protein [Enterococcus sp. MMGLQ5-2]
MNGTTVKNFTLTEFFGRIYALVGMGIGVSAVVSFLMLTVFQENLRSMAAGSTIPLFIAWIVQIALVVWLSRSSIRESGLALPGFFAYSALNGFTLSFTLAYYNVGSIAQAFLVSAIMFFAMAAFGVKTKRDLSAMGKALRAALIGLIVAIVVNIFFRSSTIDFGLSIISVLIFSGLIAYENQLIVKVYQQNNGDVREGWAIAMALSLYLDFINLFISILRITSRD